MLRQISTENGFGFRLWWIFCLGIILWFQLDFLEAQKLQIIKPPDFRNRELPAEKSYRKKNTALRRFYHNTIARYNYIYNCERLFASIMEQAKDAYREDYDELLSIYNYSLDFIADKLRPELDSILYKTRTGILMRDLRNKWVDDLYLFMGQAYYFKGEYDSAAMIFQYINFHFQDAKPKQALSKYPVLSRLNKIQIDKIFNREKQGFTLTRPPARNEALIWLLRTYIEQGSWYDAVVLMDRLQKDPILPMRLKPLLDETVAYYYYKRGDYLQAAQYYAGSLGLSRDRQEKSRRSFLVAQLYNRVGRVDLASKFLRGATKYTYDPVLEIYSRMNFILQEVHPNINIINDHIGYMLKLARRERFKRYKSLVYYACSFMALKKNDLNEALSFMQRATRYLKQSDVHERNKIYVRLFDLLWGKKEYYLAGKVLDSVQFPDPRSFARSEEIKERQSYMRGIVALYDKRNLYDSLRRLGLYSEARLMGIVQQLARVQKRELEAGLYKEQARRYFAKSGSGSSKNSGGYFSSAERVEAGIREFQSIWGNRKNVDNWRVSSRMGFVFRPSSALGNKFDSLGQTSAKDLQQRLLAGIPRTPEQRHQNDSLLARSIFQLAEQIYLHIKDYNLAAELYQDLLFGFPNFSEREALFLRLYFVFSEAEDLKNREARLKELISRYRKEYPGGKYAELFNLEGKSRSKLEKEDKQLERIYVQAFQQFKWRNFPKCMQALVRLEGLDSQGIYRYKILLMRGIYALSKQDWAGARGYFENILSGIARQQRELEEALVLARAKELLAVLEAKQGR